MSGCKRKSDEMDTDTYTKLRQTKGAKPLAPISDFTDRLYKLVCRFVHADVASITVIGLGGHTLTMSHGSAWREGDLLNLIRDIKMFDREPDMTVTIEHGGGTATTIGR